ncbi:MAG: hypothetical protein Faunusvirus12_12 [Faunusvirus sp.]|jgi:hypothetical protein|uniref:Uncharacterized protein n=1 Tax=Faunusvirus sp. TaxID=2487766 RepID=A0A3G5A1M3_9VIRU|nr:MAG: hypothetical protein Faunusvirus12_12 [Faunusvirus sp.]
MTDITTVVKDFNTQLDDFLTELEKIDSDKDIRTAHSLIQTATKMNISLIIDQYVLYICPFAKEIYSEDENFFIKMSTSEQVKCDEKGIGQIMKFTKMWATLSNRNKQCIYDYMKILTFNAQEYFKLKYPELAL